MIRYKQFQNIIFKLTWFSSTDHLMPTCGRPPDIQPKKKQKVAPEINPTLLVGSFIETFKENWMTNVKYRNESIEIINDPFKVCVINNFIDNTHFLECIKQEFYELDWNIRNMDLYEFFQSKDLKYLNFEHIRNALNFLKSDVMNWVRSVFIYFFCFLTYHCFTL